MVIIRAGRGRVEWRNFRRDVQANQAFVLLPGEWHRYRPDPRTGWQEEWFELRGPWITQWLHRGNLNQRVHDVSKRTTLRALGREFHDLAFQSGRHVSARLFALAFSIFVEITGAFVCGPACGVSRQNGLVTRACEALERGLDVNETAKALGVSYPTLHRYFREVLGVSPKHFAIRSRWARAEEHLRGDSLSMKEIAAGLGFHSASHFSLAFKKAYGCSPSEWRNKHTEAR